MRVKLGKIGSISHGVVLNRVKAKNMAKAQKYPVLTIRRLLQEEEGMIPDFEMDFPVDEEKVPSLKIAKKGMIVVGLTSFHKAAVLTEEHEGMIISSNFLVLEFPGGIMDPHYFAWYFNENHRMRQLLESVMNDQGKVKVLSIRLIRELMIYVPDLVTQMTIGKLYGLQMQKERLWKERLRLEKDMLSAKMTTFIQEEEEEISVDFTEIIRKQNELVKRLEEIEKKKKIYEAEIQLLSGYTFE